MKELTIEDIKVGSTWETMHETRPGMYEKVKIDYVSPWCGVDFTILEASYNRYAAGSSYRNGVSTFLNHYKPVYTVEGFEV